MATEIKVDPFFLRPEIEEVRDEHVGGHHGVTYTIYKQKSETLEFSPGVIFYKGTEYWTQKEFKSGVDKIKAPRGFTFMDALFKQTDESIKVMMGKVLPFSGVTEADQYVTFPGLKEKRVKALKGSVVEFNRKVVLAENTSFDSGNEKTTQNHPKMIAKAKTEVKFFPISDGTLIPRELVLAEPYDFGNLLVPADSRISLYNGKLGSIFSPRLWTAQKIIIPEWTITNTKYTRAYEKEYILLAPLPSGKLNASQYKNFFCDDDAAMTGARWGMGCHFVLTTDLTFEGVSLKKGCTVYVDGNDVKFRGFNCPEKHEFSGLTFDKESNILFGQGNIQDDMGPETPRACVTGKNIKFMSAHFNDGICVFFGKDRKPEYLWSKNNVSVGKTTYFGPTLLKVTLEKLTPVSSSNKTSDQIDLEKAEDPIFPLCTNGEAIAVFDEQGLKNSSFSLPRCSAASPSIDGSGVEYFYIQSKKKGIWQIQQRFVDERNSSLVSEGKVFWIKEVKDLSTPVVVKIGSVELLSPVLLTRNENDPSLRVRYADDDYIYLQGDLGGCYPANKKIFRLPRPKNLKIEDHPATLFPQYEITEYMCST